MDHQQLTQQLVIGLQSIDIIVYAVEPHSDKDRVLLADDYSLYIDSDECVYRVRLCNENGVENAQWTGNDLPDLVHRIQTNINNPETVTLHHQFRSCLIQ